MTPMMLSESRSGGEVGPLKATVAPPASTAEPASEVMRPPSEIKWDQVGRDLTRLGLQRGKLALKSDGYSAHDDRCKYPRIGQIIDSHVMI